MAGEFAAPGSVLEIRDETWLVIRSERATDGWFVEVQGLSELVRGTQAIFSTALDKITPLDPAKATVRVDMSPGFKQSRLWLEATLRKTAMPMTDPRLTVAPRGLLDPLPYQEAAVRQALDPENLRPRILLADAVGLGKTLEIGMILAELVRRGRGERILVVTPRHVLEQMQFELWTRFALPFVRLDSVGIQRIRQKLPANRNPFAHFKRAIVSIDTLKSDRYLAHLEKQHWDAVVIDESHNVTNDATQNNRLARLLSQKSDALILASATPHNGKAESFAELIRMLEPSAVTPDGELVEDEVRRLIIRRHRHSPDVASVVGADWAERLEPHNLLVDANPIEDEIARELEHTWLHPQAGASPYSGGKNVRLFPWILAKAFLSSPAALASSVTERLKRLDPDSPTAAKETEALKILGDLAQRNIQEGSAKYDRLVDHLKKIGISRTGEDRVVIFAERVSTLTWLQERLAATFKLKPEQTRVLHGGISDVEQQEIVCGNTSAGHPTTSPWRWWSTPRSTTPTSTPTASCCTTWCPAGPATWPSWRIPQPCARSSTGRTRPCASAAAPGPHGWPATSACCPSPAPARIGSSPAPKPTDCCTRSCMAATRPRPSPSRAHPGRSPRSPSKGSTPSRRWSRSSARSSSSG